MTPTNEKISNNYKAPNLPTLISFTAVPTRVASPNSDAWAFKASAPCESGGLSEVVGFFFEAKNEIHKVGFQSAGFAIINHLKRCPKKNRVETLKTNPTSPRDKRLLPVNL